VRRVRARGKATARGGGSGCPFGSPCESGTVLRILRIPLGDSAAAYLAAGLQRNPSPQSPEFRAGFQDGGWRTPRPVRPAPARLVSMYIIILTGARAVKRGLRQTMPARRAPHRSVPGGRGVGQTGTASQPGAGCERCPWRGPAIPRSLCPGVAALASSSGPPRPVGSFTAAGPRSRIRKVVRRGAGVVDRAGLEKQT
jgi:hypothetical protein